MGGAGSGGASCPAHTHAASGGCDATLAVVDPGGGFTKARDHHATFLAETPAGAFLFVAGGTNYTSIFSDVQRAPISADGSVGAFAAAGSLPGQNAGMCAVVGQGRVVLAGGRTGSGFRADVWSAPIAGDGSLGAFTAGAPLPEGRFHVGCALSGMHVYATGGLESAKNEATTSVFRFDVTADGTGAPVALAPLPKPVSHHATLVQGDFLYVFGGLAGNPAGVTKKQVDVLRAKIQPDGDLGAWESIATMPAWLSTHAACSFAGRAYLFGGVLDNATVSDAIYRAPFLPDGAVGPWEQLASGLPQRRSHMHHAPLHDGRVYLAGGSFFEPPSSTHQIQSTVFVGTFE